MNYNDMMRRGGQADVVYEEHKYQRILDYVIQSGILNDIDHDDVPSQCLDDACSGI